MSRFTDFLMPSRDLKAFLFMFLDHKYCRVPHINAHLFEILILVFVGLGSRVCTGRFKFLAKFRVAAPDPHGSALI